MTPKSTHAVAGSSRIEYDGNPYRYLALRFLLKLRLSLVALFDQHDGDVIAHWITASAFNADEGVGEIIERRLARRTHQDVEQLLTHGHLVFHQPIRTKI